ncbi:amidohydrolase family protein [Acidimicrobium ferrooxidans]|uniref:Amidohydrolase family protein n=1 Tax=Acidimicrobium ferrooxidans TaxID=53635 RepID=A0ABS3APP0_9ACTN|nr:amidohydrolase family protein [Acidimicrobium ferrooxidans]
MTLVLADWLISSADQPAQQGWGVRVVDGVVDHIGPNTELLTTYPDDDIVDAADHIVMPGFVNAHVHLYGTLAHGIPPVEGAAPDGFWSFLEDYWWPKVEDALDIAMIEAATDYVCAEMLRSGTTTFYDILEAPNAIPDALLAQKEVVERRGMRGLLSFEATERAGVEIARLGLEENARLIDSCGPGDLVGGLMSWHTVFTCSADYIVEAFGMAADRGVMSHAHVNEGVHEGEWAEANLGQRTVEFYDSIGVAGPHFLASQCVQLSDHERDLLAERDVRVTHMPLSNCEVGGGIAPMPELLDAGVTVGLGSDGYVNDFYEVMRGAFLLHKARLQDPRAMPAETVLEMATLGGAKALGLDRVGCLLPGWSADLQVVDARFPTPITQHNIADQIVLWRNHSHVRDVMVAGLWRVRRGEVLGADIDRLLAHSREQAVRLWEVGR